MKKCYGNSNQVWHRRVWWGNANCGRGVVCFRPSKKPGGAAGCLSPTVARMSKHRTYMSPTHNAPCKKCNLALCRAGLATLS